MTNLTTDTPVGLLQEVLARGRWITCPAGSSIAAPAGGACEFYYVRKGTVEISYTASRGTRITVALIGAGEFFGEIGFFDQGSRVRNIEAAQDVELVVFDTGIMAAMREKAPDLYTDFVLYLTRRICGKFRRLAGESAPVAAYADALSARRSCKYSQARPLPPALVNSELFANVRAWTEQAGMELFDLSHALQESSSRGQEDPASEQRILRVLEQLVDSLPAMEQMIAGSGYEEILWGHIFKELYPFFMRSRFVERTYHKPKGYAGDFLMMEHIYRNEPEGDGRLGELIDAFCLNRPVSRCIRGRRTFLSGQLGEHAAVRLEGSRRVAVMNLACGSSRELFDFLATCGFAGRISALCVDVDADALQFTNQYVDTFSHGAAIRLMRENVIKWALGKTCHQIGEQDIIYSAGLCDYLDDRLFRALIERCHDHLRPGGVLILGNLTVHKDQVFMDHILRWKLIYRSKEDLEQLFGTTSFGQAAILSEEEGINLFAVACK